AQPLGDLDADEAALAAARERFAADWGDGVPGPSGRAAEVRGELAALRGSLERGEAEVARLVERHDALAARATELAAEAARLRAELADAEAAEEPIVARLDEAEQARIAAAEVVDAIDAERATARAELQRWQARAEALALALDEARTAAGAEQLGDVPGVVGTLLDVIDVDPGWEAAFEAAAGDAITAVVVTDVSAGRRALEALHRGSASGAILALGATGSAAPAPTVPGAEPVRRHVRSARPDVEALLDVLLGPAVAVDGDWASAVDVALAHPTAVVVTRDGDRFGASGWRIGVGGTGATGAALDEARQRAAEAEAAVAALDDRHATAATALDRARAAEADVAHELDLNDGRMSAAGDALGRAETERHTAGNEADALAARRAELEDRRSSEQARVTELEAVLPVLEDEEQARVERGRALAEARARLDDRATELAARRRALDVRSAGVEQRRDVLRRRLAEIEARLERDAEQRQLAGARREEVDRRALATGRLTEVVEARLAVVDTELAGLQERRRRQSEATRAAAAGLEALRRERTELERRLGEQRERLGRAELGEAEARMRIEGATETLRRDLDVDPDTAVATPCPDLAAGATAAGRARELERELRLMGPINPLALEEYEALQERNAFLEGQLDDVKSTRRDLAKVIRAVDGEIMSVFAAAFADVAANFTALFETLFPGGNGSLRLTDPDDLLSTGIEVEARPSGKNVRKLSLLSGGERSLTALAFLFAVFRSRPSPFYVMDEVEAALDDVNLHRFLELVHEFRSEAQLLIVSHQKRTMEAADCLYGVTMQPGGSSRVVAEKVSSSS
ncbi:MAG TPA: hypothetical protein VK866_10325, partial [Acidimicrobiales bacterium]|nr:hypothetical protein [Acidimicrobiales bacterium]